MLVCWGGCIFWAALVFSCSTWTLSCSMWTLSCSMWNLVPDQEWNLDSCIGSTELLDHQGSSLGCTFFITGPSSLWQRGTKCYAHMLFLPCSHYLANSIIHVLVPPRHFAGWTPTRCSLPRPKIPLSPELRRDLQGDYVSWHKFSRSSLAICSKSHKNVHTFWPNTLLGICPKDILQMIDTEKMQ